MLKLTYILLFTSFLFASCAKDLSKINPSFVKIYYFNNEINNDVFCFDAKKLPGDEILVFGVGSNADNRFDTDGRLYLQKIKANGETAWHDFTKINFKSGFPSNVIEVTPNNFLLIWSKDTIFKAVSIDVSNDLPIVKETLITKISPFITTSVINLVKSGSDYLVQGTASENYIKNNVMEISKKIYLTKLDNNFKVLQYLSQQEYNRDAFGQLGSDDLPYIKRIGKFINLWKNGDIWYSNAPYKDGMALKEIGNTVPVYTDSLKWINGYNFTKDNKLSVVFTHPDNISEVFYQNNIDLSKINANSSIINSETLKGWDTSSPFIITYISELDKTLITGTSRSGQVKLRLIRSDNSFTIHDELGQTFPYKPAQVLLNEESRTLTIIGTTLINNSDKRIFMIKLPYSEL